MLTSAGPNATASEISSFLSSFIVPPPLPLLQHLAVGDAPPRETFRHHCLYLSKLQWRAHHNQRSLKSYPLCCCCWLGRWTWGCRGGANPTSGGRSSGNCCSKSLIASLQLCLSKKTTQKLDPVKHAQVLMKKLEALDEGKNPGES
jgi:hypothetical protein